MKRVAALVIGLGLLMPAAVAAQETKRCGERGAPWIRLHVEGLGAELQTLVMTHVRSSLAARDIDVCVSSEVTASPPLATLEVTTSDPGVATSLVVDDGVTHKRVSRELDVRGVPSDGRALTIALALDELMRASWAELILPDSSPPSPPPSVVTAAIGPQAEGAALTRESRGPRWELAAACGGEHFGEGHDQLGLDIIARYFPWSRVGFDGRLGWRIGLPVQAARGEVRSTSFTVGFGPAIALVPRTGRINVDLFGEGALTRVDFVADPRAPEIRGNERAVLAMYLVAGVSGSIVVLPRARVLARVGGGVPLHTAYAKDGDVRVSGLAGPLAMADVGISFAF